MRTGVVFCIGIIAGGLISLIYVLTRTERKRRRKNGGGGGPYSGSSHLETNGRVSDGNRYIGDTISRSGSGAGASDKHPVLKYQRMHDKGINPASTGDPIRIPDVSGPLGNNNSFYDASYPGPYPGE